jgi:acyl-CoA thioester hydrolase
LIAPAESQATLVWMVLRHEIDYQAPALPTDHIILRTWVGAAEGLRFDRHTEVLRAVDRKVLAKARTVWCPIDPVTSRPKRISEEIRSLFSVKS